MQTDFAPKSRRKFPPSPEKNRDFHGDGGLSSQNSIAARNCRTDNFFIGRQFLGRENAPARNANPSFSRRYLDPKYSRWMSADPAVGDYMLQTEKGEGGIYNLANLNLYHYGGNNPVKYVDPNGKDIVLLLDKDRGRSSQPVIDKIPFGHSAVLIGNDNDGWLYYSNDGPNSTDVQWFDSKEDFFDNYSKDRTNPFNFEEAGSVETNAEQDKAMQTEAFNLAGLDEKEGFDAKGSRDGTKNGSEKLKVDKKSLPSYKFLTNNCSEHVGKIARKGGVVSTSNLIPKLQKLVSPEDYIKENQQPPAEQ